MKYISHIIAIILAASILIAADGIEKKSSVKTWKKYKVERDTYYQEGERVLEITRRISLTDDNQMTQHKIFWKDLVVVEYDISHFAVKPGHYIHFHSVPGINAVTESTSEGKLQGISLISTNLTVLRSFTCVDGLLSPVPTSQVKKANAFMAEVGDLIGDFSSGKADKDEFMDGVKTIVEREGEDGRTKR